MKDWLRNLVYNFMIVKFTRDNFRQLCRFLLNAAKQKAEQTETIIDNWALEAFENYVENDERFNRLFEFLERYLIPNQDGACRALPVTVQFVELAEELAKPTADEPENNCKAVDLNLVVNVLQAILPIIIELWQRTQEKK